MLMRKSRLGVRCTQCFGVIAVSAAIAVGCNGGGSTPDGGGHAPKTGGGKRVFLSMGTAPVGGAFPVVGGAICEVLNNHKGDNKWKLQAKGSKGSQANIRGLDSGDFQLALSNSAISYFAVRGESGWEKKYDIRAIATLAPNVAMFITKADSGIKKIADLKGKRVMVGPSGAGFEMFVKPLLAEHGVTYDDFTPLNGTQSGAVDALADNAANAAFLGGAVPTGSITQACASHDIYFIPFDADKRALLIEKYPFFHEFTIAKTKYTDLTEDFAGLNVGSMHLITSAGQDAELIYQITKTIWDNRAEIVGKHPAGKAINEKNVARYTGTDFHPGAIRFYKEIGIWPEANQAEPAAVKPSAAKPVADES